MILLVEFSARGIDAHPRHDVFTYAAWQALGRHVKKGEHGVAVPVYVDKETVNEDGTKDERTIRTTAHVFHISQTEPNEEPTPGVAITADGVAPCELFGDTLTLTGPVQPQEATT
jgi:antirestriction protein ArdC